MIAQDKVDEVERLLAESKLSQRRIAGLTGISRATVGTIAAGKRPDYAAIRQAKSEWDLPPGPLVRCPGCGGSVYLPCRLCRVRQLKARDAALRRARRRAVARAALRELLVALRDKCA